MRGDGSLYKRGNVYWMKYYVDGIAYAESTGCTVKDDAKARLREKNKEIRTSGWLPPEKARITVGELMKDLLQFFQLNGKSGRYAAVEACWRLHLQAFFENLRADKIGTQNFRDYCTQRLSQGATNATINRELQSVGAAFKMAFQHEPPKVQRIPKIEWLPEDNARRVFIDADDMQKLKTAAKARSIQSVCALEIMFTYGWRRGEVVNLKVRNVFLADKAIRLDDTKNGDGREVPITATLEPLLTALVVGRKAEESLLGFDEYQLHEEWQRICKAAGLKPGRDGIVLHDIRRSSARNKRRAGVDQSVIMELHGWRTDEMFRRYAIVDIADKRQALELEQRAGGNA